MLMMSEAELSCQFEDRAFRVVNDTYVTAEDGTGIVHQAPAFGEDDHRVSVDNGVIRADEMPPCPIDDAGRFTKEVPDFAGQHVKVCLAHIAEICESDKCVKVADKDIQKILKAKGRLIVQSTLNHSYPYCWR
jgi:isoleucyl-tRNA synthetase